MSDQGALLLRKQLKGARVQVSGASSPSLPCLLQHTLTASLPLHLPELARSPIDGFSAGLVDDSNGAVCAFLGSQSSGLLRPPSSQSGTRLLPTNSRLPAPLSV